MALWQIALLGLGLAWIVQSIGVWLQMRHYQRTFAAVRARWSDGRFGSGAAPGRLGQGVIVVLVVDPASIVRQVFAMQGRSVFAKFKDRGEFTGLSIDELKRRAGTEQVEPGMANAISKAIEQIENLGGAVDPERGETVSVLATA